MLLEVVEVIWMFAGCVMRNEDSGEMGMVYIDSFSYLDSIR